MRDVTVTIKVEVPDDVTDEQIQGWLPSMVAPASEAVCGYDDSGNEIRFPSRVREVALSYR